MVNKFLDDFCTVVGERLAVFRLPQIWKNCQYLDGQVAKIFLEIFGGIYWIQNPI